MQEQEVRKSGFFQFLLSKTFLFNLLIAGGVLIVLFFILTRYLNMFTHHGEELSVPDFQGYTMHEIDSAGFAEQFDFFVIDSIYDDDNRPGAVVIQNPQPGSKVKQGRNIYFTIVATSDEMVVVPDLKDLTLRQAINILESARLKTGKLIYKPSFDKNAVLEQFYNNDTVFPGDTIPRGSVIDMEIGSGERNYRIPVPFLIGKTREEAIYELNIASFNLGSEFYMDSIVDENQRVYMQEPMAETEEPYFPGDSIHLWYRSDTLFNFEAYLQTFLPDSLQADSLTEEEPLEF